MDNLILYTAEVVSILDCCLLAFVVAGCTRFLAGTLSCKGRKCVRRLMTVFFCILFLGVFISPAMLSSEEAVNGLEQTLFNMYFFSSFTGLCCCAVWANEDNGKSYSSDEKETLNAILSVQAERDLVLERKYLETDKR